jgi:hypothetical protein
MYTITPSIRPGLHRTGTLHGVTYDEIVRVLGFTPNIQDDVDKVKHSWSFYVDLGNDEQELCAIWDWKGSSDSNVWSTYGPSDIIDALFKDAG